MALENDPVFDWHPGVSQISSGLGPSVKKSSELSPCTYRGQTFPTLTCSTLDTLPDGYCWEAGADDAASECTLDDMWSEAPTASSPVLAADSSSRRSCLKPHVPRSCPGRLLPSREHKSHSRVRFLSAPGGCEDHEALQAIDEALAEWNFARQGAIREASHGMHSSAGSTSFNHRSHFLSILKSHNIDIQSGYDQRRQILASSSSQGYPGAVLPHRSVKHRSHFMSAPGFIEEHQVISAIIDAASAEWNSTDSRGQNQGFEIEGPGTSTEPADEAQSSSSSAFNHRSRFLSTMRSHNIQMNPGCGKQSPIHDPQSAQSRETKSVHNNTNKSHARYVSAPGFMEDIPELEEVCDAQEVPWTSLANSSRSQTACQGAQSSASSAFNHQRHFQSIMKSHNIEVKPGVERRKRIQDPRCFVSEPTDLVNHMQFKQFQ
eukprot:gnl/TRDRNA2_/TRDRNA2_147474_c0_seq1.p1 gnl/TRDRNA2_/TRDRNA2_147474_c0~~gnl/TRDRNA2_/TRDRNA2_147474_c0_seq1.p1  ORF type:complete len:442 (+),score=55.07 gnl/TRDRNA2_/TRDRNA2_147474_c0_seq1:29-1327(+)